MSTQPPLHRWSLGRAPFTDSEATPAWVPGTRFEEAVVYAVRAHARQARKGGTVPYISHLFAVASLVMEDGGTADETIAALLHDAAEDQGGAGRLRDIEERFGPAVGAIVLGCSDTLETPKPPWMERKRAYVEHLAMAGLSVLRVSLADKLHNVRSIAADFSFHGEKLWERFNAGRDDQAWYYRQLLDAYRAACRKKGIQSPMLALLEKTIAEAFG